MKQALIIFVRNPVLGKVKTRIAKTAGAAKALAIYKELLQHTQGITQKLCCDKYIFYADAIAQEDVWEDDIYYKMLQNGNNLGARMQAAFEHLFSIGYQHICIIGSDSFELTKAIIQQAFDVLQHCDAVIGPAADGGYYLLGLSAMQPSLFLNIEWSSSNVLAQTTNACIASQIAYKLLGVLHDIDDEKDWLQHKNKPASL